MPWAKNLLASIDDWLKGLFGRREKAASERVVASAAQPVRSHVPFAAFSNPFLDGTGAGRSPEELVRYSFEAFEAWARDRDLARLDHETPLEFAARVGDEFAWLRPDSRKLALLVARMVYATGNLPTDSRETLDAFWDRITSGADETVEVRD
jgi:hypothetical protein